jgi:hypothetical protein
MGVRGGRCGDVAALGVEDDGKAQGVDEVNGLPQGFEPFRAAVASTILRPK